MAVYALDAFDKPRYAATVHHSLRAGHRNRGSDTCWCCPYGKGHRTPRAAAQHAARLMVEPWVNYPKLDAKGVPVS